MKQDPSSSGQPSILQASNEFLRRELQRIETERDAMRRELQQIHQSYAWRIIGGYRRWMASQRDNFVGRFYEKLALWILDRIVGNRELDETKRYQLWLEAHKLTPERIETLKAAAATFPYRPLMTVVLSVGSASSEKWLAATIDSIRAQLYDNWQFCIASDESSGQSVEAMLTRYSADDSRIVVRPAATSDHAANAAIDLDDFIKGEFITFLDRYGQLGADAFYQVVKRLNRSPLDDLFYWDEDKLDPEGRRTEPFFKPEWSPDLLLSMNYLGECFVVRRALVEKLGGLRRGLAPSQNYDLALRAVEQTDRIVHLPEVLYHRRNESVSLPQVAGETSERDLQNTRAIGEALRRRGEHGRVDIISPGLYAARYDIRDQPLVSILIPTRDKCQLLRQCLESIDRNTDYSNYEIIVLDNDSAEPETLAYFKEVAGKVKVHRCPGRFNFSAINNLGAATASGEFLLFLNNDTQVIRRDWMSAMIEQAQRPEVGAVGAKLLFADRRIQHAGIVLGIWGMVGHAFRFKPGDAQHYFGLSDAVRDCSAVTAACLMMRRSLFDEIEGFDEKLSIEFNDVDLCLRLRQRGYRVVYTPLALLYHYEGATRRRIHVPSDLELFVKRWGSCLKNGDPYYNRHLTVAQEDWTIAL
jgi:GT2 family glycosyltransferase